MPDQLGLKPGESVEWLEQNMIPFYPLGEIKDALPEVAK